MRGDIKNPLTEIWQRWFVVLEAGRVMSGRNGALQCSVNKIEGGAVTLNSREQH